MNNNKQRFFKVVNRNSFLDGDIFPFVQDGEDGIYLGVSNVNSGSFFFGHEVEEVFEEQSSQANNNEKVIDDNGVKCIYRDGIREFETGAVRSDNRGRERYDLIPQFALDMAAEVFGKNCGEFGSGNHMKCLPEKVCVESLLRHMASLNRWMQGVGELNEEDVASMVNNVMMLAHTVRAKRLGFYNKKHNW